MAQDHSESARGRQVPRSITGRLRSLHAVLPKKDSSSSIPLMFRRFALSWPAGTWRLASRGEGLRAFFRSTAEADRRRPARMFPFSTGTARRVGRSTLVADCAVMLLGWARQPTSIGAIAPSTRGLAEAMARAIEFRKPGIVVELGGGTGAVTRALLDSGLAPEHLVVVERNKRLYRLLRRRFPRVRILLADAASLDQVLGRKALGTISAVVSGLPLLSLPRKTRDAVLESSFRLLGEDDPFVQFTYGPDSPVPVDFIRRHSLESEALDRVWLNFPPATIWRYRRADSRRANGS